VAGGSLIKNIGRLLEQGWEVKITHSYREANACADALANIGSSLDLNTMYFDVCPSQVRNLLAAHSMGLLSPRLIPL
jgi:hypothetical protein